jgi:hypothetical protein
MKNMLNLRIEDSKVYIEPADTKLKNGFCMPNWTVANTMRWLMKRITGTRGKYGYLLYPSSDKYINFATLDGLLKSSQKDPNIYVFNTTNMDYENKVFGWKAIGVDYMGVQELGGGQVLGFDSKTKSFLGLTKDDEFIYSDVIKKINGLQLAGKASMFDQSINNDSTKYNYACHLTGETDKDILKNMYYNNFIWRYSLQNMLKIQVVGNSKRFAGQKIDVLWPSVDLKEVYNPMDSGMYLIKSITHQFSPMRSPLYSQVLVLIKNAYSSNKIGNNVATSGGSSFNFTFGKL